MTAQHLVHLDHPQQVLARRAALRARGLYPGVVAELVFRELIAYAEFGCRFSRDALLPRLVDDLLRTPGNVDSA